MRIKNFFYGFVGLAACLFCYRYPESVAAILQAIVDGASRLADAAHGLHVNAKG